MSFPLFQKESITLTDGKTIKGEFREGMLIKMFKWQWYDTKGKLHELKEGDVQKVVFEWDYVYKKERWDPTLRLTLM